MVLKSLKTNITHYENGDQWSHQNNKKEGNSTVLHIMLQNVKKLGNLLFNPGMLCGLKITVSSQNVTQTMKSLWTHAYYIIAFFTGPKSRHYFIMNVLSFYDSLYRNVGNMSFQSLPSMDNVEQITACNMNQGQFPHKVRKNYGLKYLIIQIHLNKSRLS